MNTGFRRILPVLLIGALWGSPLPALTLAEDTDVHARYQRALARYVSDGLVDYEGWQASPEDRAALSEYVRALESQDPDVGGASTADGASTPDDAATAGGAATADGATTTDGVTTDSDLAYWINLYNAATLVLVLSHYPVDSIRDIDDPWGQPVVTIAGDELSLDQIEHEVIRQQFSDSRIHFALNCAARGCPPLQAKLFTPEQLSDQLDATVRDALNDERWLRVDGGTVYLSQIFEWFGEDFLVWDGGIRNFLARYYEGSLPRGEYEIAFLEYDWSLNRLPNVDDE